MKRILIGFAVMISLNVQAQDAKITEKQMFINDRFCNALELKLEGDPLKVQKRWLDYCKSELNLKLKKKEDGWAAEKVIVHTFSDKKIDFVSSFYVSNGAPVLISSISLGYNIYVTSETYVKEYNNLKTFLERFSYIQYDEYYTRLIDVRKKELKENEKLHANTTKIVVKDEKLLVKLEKKNEKKPSHHYEFKIQRSKESLTSNRNLEGVYESEIIKIDQDISYAGAEIVKIKSVLNGIGKLTRTTI